MSRVVLGLNDTFSLNYFLYPLRLKNSIIFEDKMSLKIGRSEKCQKSVTEYFNGHLAQLHETTKLKPILVIAVNDWEGTI